MAGFLNWWDGVELWLSGRGFVLQAFIVIPIVMVAAYGLAVLLDDLLGRGIAGIRLVRRWGRSGGRKP